MDNDRPAPESSQRWVVTPEWLYQHLADPTVVIVDCRFALMEPDRGHQQYQLSHIPGAHYLDLNRDLSSPVQRHGGRHPLPDPAQLAEKLTAIGVRSKNSAPGSADAPDLAPTRVVVYDDSRLAFAARLWWLLRYVGHDQVAVLDSGFAGWQAAGYPVTAEIPAVRPGNFVPQLRSDWIVDIAAIQAQLADPQFVLIDAREAERYRGEREPIDPVAGHIPGAVNYPWQDVTDPQGHIYPPEQQQQRWTDLPPRERVVYCGSGVTACVNLLSLTLAGETGKLYPGSWSDWCSYL